MNTGTTAVFQPTIRASEELVTNAQFGKVVPLQMFSPELAESLRAISELAKLPDNWDSYGSPKLQRSAVERALQVLVTAARSCNQAPRVVPVSGGGLQFEWEAGTKELEVEILSNGSIEVLLIDGETMFETPLPEDSVNSIVPTLLNWLTADNIHATSIR